MQHPNPSLSRPSICCAHREAPAPGGSHLCCSRQQGAETVRRRKCVSWCAAGHQAERAPAQGTPQPHLCHAVQWRWHGRRCNCSRTAASGGRRCPTSTAEAVSCPSSR